jgi:hypothetical protein
MAMSEPFQALAATEFRSLKIHRGSEKEDLSCSFEIHDVETGICSYTAISYVWGTPEDPHFKCYVDGFPFCIRQNAYSVLRRLQSADEDVLVWLDTLCVNQKDKTEKSQQIRLMCRIYERAQSTSIWLGQADDSTKHVFDYANTLDIAKIMDEINSYNRSNRSNHETKSFLLDELVSHPERNSLVNGIAQIFHATWFSRVWIRQEAAVGGDPYALRGPYIFTWVQLTALAFLFMPRFKMSWPDWATFRYYEIEPSITTLLSINHYRTREIHHSTYMLFGHMVNARTSLATVPHDKVYAMSGMVSGFERSKWGPLLEPNYNLSWQEVYVMTAKFLFTQFHINWLVLEEAGLIHQGVNSDLPSWVPDWRYNSPEQFVRPHDWSAGGASSQVKATVLNLSKRERRKLLTYKGFASIMPLCGMSEKHEEKQVKNQVLLKDTNSTRQEDRRQEEILRIQGEWLQTQKSASRAPSILEISVLLQDKITYICPRSISFVESELIAFREAIVSCDKQNLRFLQSLKDDQYITSESLVTAYNKTLISSQDFEDKHASGDIDASAKEWRNWLKDGDLANPPPYHKVIENSSAFRDHSFAWTENGYMALLPCFTQAGDHIVVFSGYKMPYVIRPVKEWYMLIGMCYIHGMMSHNASTLIEEFDIKLQRGEVIIKRPQGDVRANGKKYDAGRYVDILQTLGKRNVKLI